MNNKYLKVYFFISIFVSVILAQYPQNTTYKSIFASIPAMPNYLDSIVDTSLPTPMIIKRITEYDSSSDRYPTHDYSKIQAWNVSESVYKFSAVAIYDAKTHKKIRGLPGGEIYPCYWSNTNENLLYSFRENGEIKMYSVSRDTVITLSNEISGYDIVKLGPGEGNFDKNDHYVSLVGKKGSDMDVIVFDMQKKKIIHTETFKGAWGSGSRVPDYVDWVSVSQSGKYTVIMWNHNTTKKDNPFNGHYGVEVYSTTDMKYLRRIADYGNHGDLGYDTYGNEVLVQFWGRTGSISAYRLDTLYRMVISDDADFTYPNQKGGHISCRNINRPGWAYVSTEVNDISKSVIVAFKIDTTKTVEFFAHHFSTSSSYAKSPMVTVAPNGDKVMYKSDFGDSSNAKEVYVFEAKVLGNATSSLLHINNNIRPHITISSVYYKTVIVANKTIKDIFIYDLLGKLLFSRKNINSKMVLYTNVFGKKPVVVNATFSNKNIVSEIFFTN